MHHRLLPALAAAAAVTGTGLTANAAQTVDATIADAWEVFNTTDWYTNEGNANRVRSNVFDGQGMRQPYLKFDLSGLNQDLSNLVSAKLELTVLNFDTEDGYFEWTLYGINDGVTNEDFQTGDNFANMPGFITNQTPVYTAIDPNETTQLDGFNLLLDDADLIPNLGDPRPQPGDITSLSGPNMVGFLQGDTNDTVGFMLWQTTGENGGFRATWAGIGSVDRPRLVLQFIPSPTAAFGGIGLLGAVAMRRRCA